MFFLRISALTHSIAAASLSQVSDSGIPLYICTHTYNVCSLVHMYHRCTHTYTHTYNYTYTYTYIHRYIQIHCWYHYTSTLSHSCLALTGVSISKVMWVSCSKPLTSCPRSRHPRSCPWSCPWSPCPRPGNRHPSEASRSLTSPPTSSASSSEFPWSSMSVGSCSRARA